VPLDIDLDRLAAPLRHLDGESNGAEPMRSTAGITDPTEKTVTYASLGKASMRCRECGLNSIW
jgi:hypothetical protein